MSYANVPIRARRAYSDASWSRIQEILSYTESQIDRIAKTIYDSMERKAQVRGVPVKKTFDEVWDDVAAKISKSHKLPDELETSP